MRHPFSDKYGLKQGTTDNLMDYTSDGLALKKYQWDIIHDPQNRLFAWAEGEEEGDYTAVGLSVLNELKNSNNTYSFINPAGKIVSLPENTSQVIFCTYDRYFKTDKTLIPTDFSSPIGCLLSFSLNNKTYTARGNSEKGFFAGYACNNATSEDDFYFDTISYQLKPSEGIVLITTIESGQFVGYAAKFSPINRDLQPNSKGSGHFQKSLFINYTETEDLIKTVKDYLTSKTTKTIRITDINYLTQNEFSIINTNPPQRADEFLKSVLNENSPLADVLVYFALIYTSPEAIEAIGHCNNENANEIHKGLLAAFNHNLYSYLSGGSVVDKSTMDKLSEEFLAVAYRSFNEMQQAKTLENLINNAKSIHEVKSALEQYNSSCILRAINLDVRLKVFEWLFNNNNDYWTINNKNIVYELLANAPYSHVIDILKAFAKDNYKWLYTLWDKGSEKYREKVIDLIVQLVQENYVDLGITPTSKQVYMHDFGTFVDVPVAQSPFCIGLKDNKSIIIDPYHTIERSEYDQSPEIDFEDNGKIRFTQEYTLTNNTVIVQNINSRDVQRKFHEKIDYSLQPFEPVTIYFGRNYPTLGIINNEAYVVPAIWALRMADAASDEEFNENLRKAGNITALLLTPFTGGSSSSFVVFIGRLTAAVAFADELISKERNTLSPDEYNNRRDFYEAWDKFYFSVAIADGATALAGLAKTITIPRTFSELNSLVNTKWNSLSSTIQDAWNGLKALRVATGTKEILGEVTKEIVKQKLPPKFVEALKTFGKSEDEIMEYFISYHNTRSGRKFFNDIENYLENFNTANLTREEAYALWGYTTNFFYRDLNAWLRTNSNIAQTGEIASLINSGLSKLPSYSGKTVFRGIIIDVSDLQDFLNSYKTGVKHTWGDFTSCGGTQSASFSGRAEVNVIFEITHITGKDISDFADGIRYGIPPMEKPEILIKSGSQFEVIANPTFDATIGKWIIKLTQIK